MLIYVYQDVRRNSFQVGNAMAVIKIQANTDAFNAEIWNSVRYAMMKKKNQVVIWLLIEWLDWGKAVFPHIVTTS